MKKRLAPVFLLALLSLPLLPAKSDADVISMMEFYNADIKSVIDYVSDVTGYTIIVDPTVQCPHRQKEPSIPTQKSHPAALSTYQ